MGADINSQGQTTTFSGPPGPAPGFVSLLQDSLFGVLSRALISP